VRVCVCVSVDACVHITTACTRECVCVCVCVRERERVPGYYYFWEEKSWKSGAGYHAPRVILLLQEKADHSKLLEPFPWE
jgi:hypothetical protein